MPSAHADRRDLATARIRRAALVCALTTAAVLATAGPAAAGPVMLTPPTLERTGRTLSTDNGTWLPAGNAHTYGWQRCDATVSSCVSVPGRTASTYLLSTADIGKRIRSVVGATNNLLGSTIVTSAATDPVAPAPPSNVVPPAVTLSGTKATSTLGIWSDPSPNAVAYGRQWQRCSGGDAASCESISGETGAAYTASRADDGRFLRVVVGAEGLGTAAVASPPVGPVTLPSSPAQGGGDTGGDTGGGTNKTPDSGRQPTSKPRKLRPFPKVVIAGRLARGLTFISSLVISRGPRGASVAVTCRGRGCPRGGRFRGRLGRNGALRLRRFQRIYGPGAVIEIRVTKSGAIGKFTRLRVRSRSIPGRRDACLVPGSSRPKRCP